MTYRWHEHVGPNRDFHLGYRTEAEAVPWKANDQVARVGDTLEVENRRKIEVEIEEEIKAALAFADSSPFPKEEELYADVYQ